MIDFDLSQMQEMDKGTLSSSNVTSFKKTLKITRSDLRSLRKARWSGFVNLG